ncbi:MULTISPECIES: hypothetical protein [unclassified Cytobacillus]|mgnify:FL=1|uniref:hypothetical protein n=1 Tax=unclassified Cytobacillus TaxID=2675268 RepID=UPI0013572B56|nr:hypothetical protein [Cytobacillus sp. AMY 15.2]KAF0817601.1 hypothetical protein KIS4809_3654 [Bacillus sp. ZZV12-4809]MCM3089767.1 hypothetical protein [Cytobacillus sp. AMY 15.2]
MNIFFAVTVLIYTMLLIFTYGFAILTDFQEDKGEEIFDRAFKNAYVILLFGLLIIYTLIQHPHIPMDSGKTSYLLLASKFLSLMTLGVSLFIFSRKNYSL